MDTTSICRTELRPGFSKPKLIDAFSLQESEAPEGARIKAGMSAAGKSRQEEVPEGLAEGKGQHCGIVQQVKQSIGCDPIDNGSYREA